MKHYGKKLKEVGFSFYSERKEKGRIVGGELSFDRYHIGFYEEKPRNGKKEGIVEIRIRKDYNNDWLEICTNAIKILEENKIPYNIPEATIRGIKEQTEKREGLIKKIEEFNQ